MVKLFYVFKCYCLPTIGDKFSSLSDCKGSFDYALVCAVGKFSNELLTFLIGKINYTFSTKLKINYKKSNAIGNSVWNAKKRMKT